jgi:hypothetical protein
MLRHFHSWAGTGRLPAATSGWWSAGHTTDAGVLVLVTAGDETHTTFFREAYSAIQHQRDIEERLAIPLLARRAARCLDPIQPSRPGPREALPLRRGSSLGRPDSLGPLSEEGGLFSCTAGTPSGFDVPNAPGNVTDSRSQRASGLSSDSAAHRHCASPPLFACM